MEKELNLLMNNYDRSYRTPSDPSGKPALDDTLVGRANLGRLEISKVSCELTWLKKHAYNRKTPAEPQTLSHEQDR